MKLIAITTALVAAGCVSQGLPDGADGGTPTTGLYRLTQTTTGSCSPAEVDGISFGSVDGDKTPALVIALTPEMFGPPPAGFPVYGASVEIQEISNGQTTAFTLDVCNANLSETYTVEEQAADHLRVRRDTTLSGVANANQACLPDTLPSADCTQSSEIEYELTQPCPQSCIQSDAPSDPTTQPATFHCSC